MNVMARMYGNVRPVSMAKPRTKGQKEAAENLMVTNATAGKPGVAVPANRIRQTTLFRRSSA